MPMVKYLLTSHQSPPPKFTPSLSLYFTSTQLMFMCYSCFHCAKSGQSSTWCLNLLPDWKALSSSAHPIVGARWPEWRGLQGEMSHLFGHFLATMNEGYHQPLYIVLLWVHRSNTAKWQRALALKTLSRFKYKQTTLLLGDVGQVVYFSVPQFPYM